MAPDTAAPPCDRCEDRAPNVCVCIWDCGRHEGCAGDDRDEALNAILAVRDGT